MASIKFLAFLCLLATMQLVSAAPKCETSTNCKKCLKMLSQQNPNEKQEVLKEFCLENGDRIAMDLANPSVGYDVKLRVYNLSNKVDEVFGNDKPEAVDPIYKTIVVYGKEFNLLPSSQMITQNNPDESPLGLPIQIAHLGTTRVTEQQFLDYLDTLNLAEFKDETFDEHLDQILDFLLSNPSFSTSP